jgi:hypothetical protein
MRLFLAFSLVSLIALGSGCNSAAKPTITKAETPKPQAAAPAPAQSSGHNHADDANTPRINLVDAKKQFEAGTAVFLDTRDITTFNFSRIKGALHVPPEMVASQASKLPKDKTLIAYCS